MPVIDPLDKVTLRIVSVKACTSKVPPETVRSLVFAILSPRGDPENSTVNGSRAGVSVRLTQGQYPGIIFDNSTRSADHAGYGECCCRRQNVAVNPAVTMPPPKVKVPPVEPIVVAEPSVITPAKLSLLLL